MDVVCTPQDKAYISRQAKKYRMSVSQFIVWCCKPLPDSVVADIISRERRGNLFP